MHASAIIKICNPFMQRGVPHSVLCLVMEQRGAQNVRKNYHHSLDIKKKQTTILHYSSYGSGKDQDCKG